MALGSKIKPWGIILDALDIGSWAAEALSNGRLQIDYKIEIVFEYQINLVGKKLREDPKTKEGISEKYGNIKYNFTDGGTIGDFSVQGIIKGRIEISASVEIKAKVSKKKIEPKEDKYEKKAELSIGAKAESYISVVVPTKTNEKGNLDVDFYFSGVTFEIWFKASLNIKNGEDGEPDYKKKVINEINDMKIEIKL